MFNTRFNNGYQNVDPYAAQYPAQMPINSYGQGGLLPNMINNNSYPVDPSQFTPNANVPNSNMATYAKGGKVKKKTGGKEGLDYSGVAENIRQQGGEEDTVLAHINPLEAMMLKEMGGSGEINPVTGLPQFGIFNRPGKWFKSVIGPAAGAILGNIMLPGIGGVLGGAFGGAAGSVARGRNDMGQSALRGGMMGLALPTAAGLLGSGASALGAKGLGASLSNYGAANAVLPSIGLGGMFGGEAAGAAGAAKTGAATAAKAGSAAASAAAKTAAAEAAKTAVTEAAKKGLLEKLLTEPANLLALGSVAGQMMNQPKEKTPEQQGEEYKRLQKAMRSSEEEELSDAQRKRRIARNQFLPEERLGNITPLFSRSNTPDERQQQGKWVNYYNEGGAVSPHVMYEVEIEDTDYPPGLGRFIQGDTKGQEDKIDAALSDGEYVIPADAVAHVGDGNNAAGAKEFDKFLRNVRKHRGSSIKKLPPKAKSVASYLK